MSQLEDHELVAMTQQYGLTHSGAYVCHEAYEEINRQVAAGRPWSKCSNCGNPYPLDKPGSSGTHCSEKCCDEETADLMHAGGWRGGNETYDPWSDDEIYYPWSED